MSKNIDQFRAELEALLFVPPEPLQERARKLIDHAVQEVERLEQELEARQFRIEQPESLPTVDINNLPGQPEVITARWGEDYCRVEVKFAIQYGKSNTEHVEWVNVEPFDVFADKETTERMVYDAIWRSLPTMPEAMDVGNQQIDGLTTDDILRVCRYLTPVKYVPGYDELYQQKRLEWFKKYWPQIEANTPGKNSKYRKYEVQKRARTHFFNVIDRTFKKAEKRRKRGN